MHDVALQSVGIAGGWGFNPSPVHVYTDAHFLSENRF